jgi:hypothetical protein
MPNIFEPRSIVYGLPAPTTGWSWLPFTDASYLKAVQHACQIITHRVQGHKPSNAAFQRLPGGRTFAQVWNDPDVWICYDPKSNIGEYGATVRKGIALSQTCCRKGVWTIVATLIHELAHVNGADGLSLDAELTLKQCLMGKFFDPINMGAIERGPKNIELALANRPGAGRRT